MKTLKQYFPEAAWLTLSVICAPVAFDGSLTIKQRGAPISLVGAGMLNSWLARRDRRGQPLSDVFSKWKLNTTQPYRLKATINFPPSRIPANLTDR